MYKTLSAISFSRNVPFSAQCGMIFNDCARQSLQIAKFRIRKIARTEFVVILLNDGYPLPVYRESARCSGCRNNKGNILMP